MMSRLSVQDALENDALAGSHTLKRLHLQAMIYCPNGWKMKEKTTERWRKMRGFRRWVMMKCKREENNNNNNLKKNCISDNKVGSCGWNMTFSFEWKDCLNNNVTMSVQSANTSSSEVIGPRERASETETVHLAVHMKTNHRMAKSRLWTRWPLPECASTL